MNCDFPVFDFRLLVYRILEFQFILYIFWRFRSFRNWNFASGKIQGLVLDFRYLMCGFVCFPDFRFLMFEILKTGNTTLFDTLGFRKWKIKSKFCQFPFMHRKLRLIYVSDFHFWSSKFAFLIFEFRVLSLLLMLF